MAIKATDIFKQGVVQRDGELIASDGRVIGQGMSPQQFSNWSHIGTIEFDNEAGSKTVDVSGVDRVMMRFKFTAPQNIDTLRIRPNGDATSSNYAFSMMWAQDNNNSVYGAGSQSIDGIPPISPLMSNDNHEGEIIVEASLETGRKRTFTGSGTTDNDTLMNMKSAGVWLNEADPVTYLEFINGIAGTYTIEVYAWQEMKTVDLATWELVTEMSLSNDSSWSFDMAIEQGDEIHVVSQCTSGNIKCIFDGDTGANYLFKRHYRNTTGVSIGESSETSVYAGGAGRANVLNIHVGSPYTFVEQTANAVSNSVGTGTNYYSYAGSPTVATFGVDGATTGTIGIYRLAKAHVLQNGYGLWKKFKYSNEAVNISIDISQFDGDEIMVNLVGDATDSDVNMTFNGDETSSYRQSHHYGGTTHSGGQGVVTGVKLASGHAYFDTSVSKMHVYPAVKAASGNFDVFGSDDYVQQMSFKWTGSEEISSIDVKSLAGGTFTGSVTIYRLG